MNKKGKIVLALSIILTICLTLYLVFKEDTIHTAMSHYDDHDYDSAIEVFNTLLSTTKGTDREHMLFYRCRSMDKLITQLNKKYQDELIDLKKYAKTDKEEYEETLLYLKKKIRKMNLITKSGLYLITVPGIPRITGRDTFCKELEKKYPASPFVIEYKYERILSHLNSGNPEALKIAVNFYKKYPATPRGKEILAKIHIMLREKQSIDSTLFKELTTIVTDKIFRCKKDRVNLRNKPNLKGKIVSLAQKDEIFILLQRSTGKTTLGGRSFYWYNILRNDGSRSWIYGSLIEKVNNSIANKDNNKTIKTKDDTFVN